MTKPNVLTLGQMLKVGFNCIAVPQGSSMLTQEGHPLDFIPSLTTANPVSPKQTNTKMWSGDATLGGQPGKTGSELQEPELVRTREGGCGD